jgi:hypothetical protein
MGISRRQLLMSSLGAAQLSLLGGGRARAQSTGGPTKLLVIFVRGGWQPSYFFTPLSSAEIQRVMPEATSSGGEPAYYAPEWVQNLDGSGDADFTAPFPRLRAPWLFDDARYRQGLPDDLYNRNEIAPGIRHTPNGYAWRHFQLWENTTVLHGVDHGTAAHLSGIISAMSGAPGGEYRSPAIQAVVANAMYNRFGDNDRVIPSVAINNAPDPNPFGLPAISSPVGLVDIGGLQDTLSMRGGHWSAALRNQPLREVADFDEMNLATIPSTAIDDVVRRRLRKLRGRSTTATDQMLRTLYDGVGGISKVLAKDVMTILERTPGTEYNLNGAIHWSALASPYGVSVTTDSADSAPSGEGIELALKMLKSNLSSAVTLRLNGISDYNFDSHGFAEGDHFVNLWAVMENVGRILGEMKQTPTTAGRTLLDDTLVMVTSDFARTWPHAQDHWPVTSVLLAGGGIHTNRAIGGYDTNNFAEYTSGYLGKAIDIRNIETGVMERRVPTSADVVATALKVLGIDDFFIPGGYGEIDGVRLT